MNGILINFNFQMSVMAGSMARMYGAATMVGKDEMNGRINPALEADDDLPIAEAQRTNQQQRMDAPAAIGLIGPTQSHHYNQQSQHMPQQHPQHQYPQHQQYGTAPNTQQGHTAF